MQLWFNCICPITPVLTRGLDSAFKCFSKQSECVLKRAADLFREKKNTEEKSRVSFWRVRFTIGFPFSTEADCADTASAYPQSCFCCECPNFGLFTITEFTRIWGFALKVPWNIFIPLQTECTLCAYCIKHISENLFPQQRMQQQRASFIILHANRFVLKIVHRSICTRKLVFMKFQKNIPILFVCVNVCIKRLTNVNLNL